MLAKTQIIGKQLPSREYEAVSDKKSAPPFTWTLTLHKRGFSTEDKTSASFTVSNLQW